MKLVTFAVDTELGPQWRVGAVSPTGAIVDLQNAYADKLTRQGNPSPAATAQWVVPTDMVGFLEQGERALDAARETMQALDETEATANESGRRWLFAAEEVRLLAPLPRPPTIRDFSCMEEHYRGALKALGLGPEVPRSWYEWPPYYKGNPMTVVGPEVDVEWPVYATEVDYELEVAAVIGLRGKDIPHDRARDHIVGFTIFNDISVRNIQSGEQSTGVGLSKSKDFDTGNIFGPYLVTQDEFDGLAAVARVFINGEQRNEGNLDAMYHSWEDLVVHASQSETLHPGEIFASGTLGKGSGMELGRYLEPGDLMELEVEGLGVLRNRLVKPSSEATPPRTA